MTFDIALIGAGIVGAACADSLAREGFSVVVLDQHGPATGTTASGMGHIVVMDDSDAQFALTSYSQRLWRELSEQLPPNCEYEHCGTIWVAADGAEMTEVRRKHEFYTSRGISASILDAHALAEAEPNLSHHLVGGLLVENDAVVYQLPATGFLLDRSAENGAVLRFGTGVAAIETGGVRLADGEKVIADKVLNAAGASAAILSPELKIRPRKGHLVITDRYPGFVRHQLVELGYLKSAHGADNSSVAFNVQPRKTDQVLLGSSRQFDTGDDAVDEDLLRRMTARAFEYMPALRGLSTVRVWTGFRPSTPDNLPYIGKINEHVYAAAGHEGLG
ncbi:MAG: FAD-dependent oxidoreductase, partial [Acidobacteria bacterium]|nr:FAD-dependent oxidoreductase [Acidobacteriota bacterium]